MKTMVFRSDSKSSQDSKMNLLQQYNSTAQTGTSSFYYPCRAFNDSHVAVSQRPMNPRAHSFALSKGSPLFKALRFAYDVPTVFMSTLHLLMPTVLSKMHWKLSSLASPINCAHTRTQASLPGGRTAFVLSSSPFG